VDPLAPECELEATGFAQYRGMLLMTAEMMKPHVVQRSGLSVIPVPFRSSLRIEVAIWVLPSDFSDQFIENKIDEADYAFGMGRTGLQLQPAIVHITNTAKIAVIDQGCANYAAIRGDPTIYNANMINVYVSPLWPGVLNGLTCTAQNAREIIFLRPWAPSGALAHEIGHALSLEHANAMGEHNLMYQVPQIEIRSVSIGQAYRMQIETRSWLNRGGVSTGRPLVKTCQPHAESDGVCPRQSLGLIEFP
jgi:hypothetical protein